MKEQWKVGSVKVSNNLKSSKKVSLVKVEVLEEIGKNTFHKFNHKVDECHKENMESIQEEYNLITLYKAYFKKDSEINQYICPCCGDFTEEYKDIVRGMKKKIMRFK
jgi:hypothetical protein